MLDIAVRGVAASLGTGLQPLFFAAHQCYGILRLFSATPLLLLQEALSSPDEVAFRVAVAEAAAVVNTFDGPVVASWKVTCYSAVLPALPDALIACL
jgi:hypothetical protein